MIRINLDKAKAITKDRLRAERTPLFEQNDLLLRDAIAENDEAKRQAAIAERDRLRDITKLADAADSPDALKLISVE